jgi:transposase-like protein
MYGYIMIKQYSSELKEQILKEVKETGSVSSVAKKHLIPTTTIHTWQKRLNNTDLAHKDRVSKSIKKKLSELELENQILKELLKKTHQIWLKG